MKRIARTGSAQYHVNEQPAGHAELTQILRQHLPPTTVALFARPKEVEGGVVEWYSDLGGQPVPLNQLPAAEAVQARRLLDERLDSILQLANKLEARGGEGPRQAALLRQAARYPDDSVVYALNGQPVLTFWGYGLRQPAPARAGAAGAVAAGQQPPLPPGDGAEPAPGPRRRRWWPWLLLALLALLAALLCWWLLCRAEPEAPVPPPAAEQPEEIPEPAVDEPAAEEPEQIPEAEPEPEPEPEPVAEPVAEPPPPPPPPDPLDELAKKIASTKDCATLQKIAAGEKLLKGSEAKAVALKKQLTETLNRDCRKELITQARHQCPGERPKELAPELIIVFDASGSMEYSLTATREAIANVDRMLSTLNSVGPVGQIFGAFAGAEAYAQLKREPTRITTARQATAAVVQQVPSDVNIGMVMVECCPGREAGCAGAPRSGYFAPNQRGNLLGLINGIQPRGGTPLADGVAQAGRMLDGVNRESVMLVVSDGEESCGRDPCAVAQQLARSKPYLKINVVDIMGTGAGNCLASATGGRVFTARNVHELSVMTNQAAKDVLGPGNCR